MKKILLLIIIAITATSFLRAQDLYLSWNGEKLGDTVYVWGEPTTTLIIFNAVFHNNTSSDMNVMVARDEVELLENTMSTFCWAGSCYSPTVDTSKYDFIPAGGTNDSTNRPFIGEYSPNGVIGTSTVKYTFYNINNPDQRLEVVVKYWASPQG
ncbi:MAG: hypothetical protein GXO86_05755, partial [Chlorobi bacterium]|nr:hypothetical protein [Chlorobiota bacterium]